MHLLLTLLLLVLPDPRADLAQHLRWRSIGPAIMGGRIDDIEAVDDDPDTIYAAAATGGLWKTVNGGTTPIFDNYGTTSIGDVAIAPSNSRIIWVGTGEPNNRQSSSWGNGVYKSTDAGATFTRMGLEDSHHIGRIVIDPKNPDVVYVAALGHLWGPNRTRALYTTVDGGRTWIVSKFVDENTGFLDVAMDPADSKTLYAAAYQRRRAPWGMNGGGPGSALYKSTDAGRTWTRLTGGLPTTGDAGRIGIAVYRKNPATLFVTYEHKEGGLFRSDDRGKTWTKINTLNPRPRYFSQVRIDPSDDRRVYVLGTSLFVSDDGGRTFRTDGARNVHVDHHAMWIDRGASWAPLKNGMPDVPIYDLQIHPRDRDLIVGTHGRSVYIMNIAPLQDLTPAALAQPSHVFTPRPAVAFNYLEHRDFNGQAAYVGANPPFGASIDYFLKDSAPAASVTIMDGERVVRTLDAAATAGLHRLQWDLRWTSPPQPVRNRPASGVDPSDPRPAESTLARVPGDYGGGGDPTGGEAGAPPSPTPGPMVAPGTYSVTLKSGALTSRTSLIVRGDSRVSITDEARRIHTDAKMRAYETQLAGIPANNRASDLNTQMTALAKALGRGARVRGARL